MTRKRVDKETGRQGDKEAGRQGDKETRTNDEVPDGARFTQHAIRNTQHAIRNTQYAIRPQVINLLVGNAAPSYSFDRAGRLIGAFEGGRNYRRGLDNRVLQKWSQAGVRQRRWLAPDEARTFLEAVYRLADEIAAASGDSRLDALRGWDWARLQADAAQFAMVYRPVSILPPDQYLALALQATEGCSHNRCTFCDFYRGRPFRIKTPEELRAHVAAVRADRKSVV